MKAVALHVVQTLDDWISPIVVKELRQAVKSRLISAVLMLFLLIELLVMGGFLLTNSMDGQLQQSNFQMGREVFLVLQGIMLGTCMLVIPAYAGLRLAGERSDTDVDLLFVTTLPPRSIISGKLVAALAVAILIFSACAPFMTFTYFLRGIDLPSIFIVMAMDFLAVFASVLLAMFVAVVPAPRVLKALLGLWGVGWLGYLFVGTIAMSAALLEFGASGLWESPGATAAVVCGLVGFLGGCSLLFVWSVALVNPPTANRAWPMRVLVVAYWLASGLAFGYAASALHEEAPMAVWAVTYACVLSVCLIIAVNERDHWSLRVARTIPRSFILRVPAFLLYSGSAGGTILFSLLFGATALVIVLWDRSPSHGGMHWRQPLDWAFDAVLFVFLYTYAYALTGVWLRRIFFSKLPTHFTWVIMLVVYALASVLPLIGLLLIRSGRYWQPDSEFGWLLPNGMVVLSTLSDHHDARRAMAYLCIGSWCALVTVLNFRWYWGQLASFKKPVPRPPGAAATLVLPEPLAVDPAPSAPPIPAQDVP